MRVGLDTPLPPKITIGRGTVLCVRGWCFHAEAPITNLEILVDGEPHRVKVWKLHRPDVALAHAAAADPPGYAAWSGFWGMVPLAPAAARDRRTLEIRARLRTGRTSRAVLGTIVATSEPTWEPSTAPDDGERGAVPDVTICMTTYNPPLHLFRRQVQSIRDQTHERWSCIVSDDCSHPEIYDGIRRIIGDDVRFAIHRHARRLGFYHNFESCLDRVPSGAEYVALADHDDCWHPDKLATLLARFDRGVTLVYSDMNIVDEEGRILANTYWTTRPNNYTKLTSLLLANTITGAASMFRADLLKDVLPFPQPLGEPFHDHWIGTVALATGEVRYVDRPLYDYVQHSAHVLGHFAPPKVTFVREMAESRKRWREVSSWLRRAIPRWRSVYWGDLLRIQLMVRVLQLRCGSRLSVDKARALRRILRADESPLAFAWLLARAVRGGMRVTETLGAERRLIMSIVCEKALAMQARWRSRR